MVVDDPVIAPVVAVVVVGRPEWQFGFRRHSEIRIGEVSI